MAHDRRDRGRARQAECAACGADTFDSSRSADTSNPGGARISVPESGQSGAMPAAQRFVLRRRQVRVRSLLLIACVALLASCGSPVPKAEVRAASSLSIAKVFPTVTSLVPPSNPVQACRAFGREHHLDFVQSAWDPGLGGPSGRIVAKLRSANLGVGPWGNVPIENWIYVCPFRGTSASTATAILDCDAVHAVVVDIWIDGAGRHSRDLFHPACAP